MSQFDEPRRRERQAPNSPDAVRRSLEVVETALMGALDATLSDERLSDPALFGPPLAAGELVAGRFVVERLAGWGGMGRIHVGRDLTTQERVAIKVLDSEWVLDAGRFAREALLLAEVSHPAIVRYVAHGTTQAGSPFLAMEWLDGEDLSERLARSPLSPRESFVLLRRACAGIAAAHERGIVHRDIKPSNLFLVNGDPALVKVLDFGIARQTVRTRALTQSGAVLGTVGYMAPEQARGEREVDARADVFSLGCVLFECLTGRAAFSGPNALAAIAKVLQDEPPLISECVPALSTAFDDLVKRLLSKDSRKRPANAAKLFEELAVFNLNDASSVPHSAGGVTTAEQRVVSVVVAKSCDVQTPLPDLHRVSELTRRFGMEPMPLPDGSWMLVSGESGAASDRAAHAARCALSLARGLPSLVVAVATGNAQIAQRPLTGPAVARASSVLAASKLPRSGVVALDELTAGLLDPSFQIRKDAQQLVLVGQDAQLERRPVLLGKRAPFVGRDKELGLLELTLRECCDEGVSRAALVTGPAGQGKSRLAFELIERVRLREDVTVLSARADQLGAGSAFLLVRQLIKQAAGLDSLQSEHSEQQAQLRAYVAALSLGPDAAWIADFLSELSGIAPTGPLSSEFRAARDNSQMMSGWLSRAFVRWLRAECERRPVLCVLDDLHWGDLPSVTYLGEALGQQPALRCMVLAFARPEVHAAFPRLWSSAETQELTLGRLTPRAATRLAQAALGAQLSSETLSEIIGRADGNVFYLEELIRAVARGEPHSLPQTVLALVESRLSCLHPEARRVARAASVFGETFWRGGLLVLLQGTQTGARAAEVADLDAWLHTLYEHELISAATSSIFPGEPEFRFRHELLRQAAYAMLPETDRRSAHALAGGWLEQVGAPSALALANHFELGGIADSAAHWLIAAAQSALEGGNITEVLQYADRGLRLATTDAHRGRLLWAKAEAHTMRSEWPAALSYYQQATTLLPAGGVSWLAATAGALLSASFLGDQAGTLQAMHSLLTTELHAEISGTYGMATFVASQGFAYTSQLDQAEELLGRAELLAAQSGSVDLAFNMWLGLGRAFIELSRGDLGPAYARLVSSIALAEQLGSGLVRGLGRLYLVAALAHSGHVERARVEAEAAAKLCAPLGFRLIDDYCKYFLVAAHVFAGQNMDAAIISDLREMSRSADLRLVNSARIYLTHMLLRAGDVAAADVESQEALAHAVFSTERAAAYAVRAETELRLARPAAALRSVGLGLDSAKSGAFPWTASALHLVNIRALVALGRMPEAEAAAAQAQRRLLNIASELEDAELRESFLLRMTVNVETLRLAEELRRQPA